MNESLSRRPAQWSLDDRSVTVLIVVAGLLVQLPGLFWDAPGGKAINNALRVLDGDVPYRDFWTMYAPGHFYLGAALFKVFGTYVWVQGLAAQGLIVLNAAVLFHIVRQFGVPRAPAIAAASALVAMSWKTAPELESYHPAMLLLLLALACLIRYTQQRDAWRLVLAGCLCGAAAWFKHDVAFHVTLAIVAGLAAAWVLLPRARRPDWTSPWGVLRRVAGGAILTVSPVVLLLVWSAWPEVWRDLIVFPATDFRVVRGEPYPPMLPEWQWVSHWLANPWSAAAVYLTVDQFALWVMANVPQIVFAAGVIVLLRRRTTVEPAAAAVALVCLTAMPLFWASAHVQQNTHFHSLWILSVLLGGLAWGSTTTSTAIRRWVAALFVVLTAAHLVTPARKAAEMAYSWPDHRTLDASGAGVLRLSREKHDVYQPIVAFVRDNVPASEPIYVGLVRHDAMVFATQDFYYLSGRRAATRYNELHPGITDREAVQREIIGDLVTQGVRCAILWDFGRPPAVLDGILANRRRHIPEIGATLLDAFFSREFQPMARYGEFVIAWRRNTAPPILPDVDGLSTAGRSAG